MKTNCWSWVSALNIASTYNGNFVRLLNRQMVVAPNVPQILIWYDDFPKLINDDVMRERARDLGTKKYYKTNSR